MGIIAIIEDDVQIAELVKLHLENSGFEARAFHNGAEGYEFLLEHEVTAVVLDISLPGMSGIEICTALRSSGTRTPIIMLTALSEEDEKIEGLESGADDYLTKPFSMKELTARIKAIVRRSEPSRAEDELKIISVRQLEIDPSIRKVTLDSERIDLTPKEFELLYLLASNPGVTFTRSELLNKVWGYDFDGYEHTVNSHINRLRMKVEDDPAKPSYVLTTWGVGYRFADA